MLCDCFSLHTPCSVPQPDLLARNATLLEQLADLAKQAQLATTTPLLDWLRLLTQLQLQDQQRQQERQRLLRAVVELRAQMQVGSWGSGFRPHIRVGLWDSSGLSISCVMQLGYAFQTDWPSYEFGEPTQLADLEH